LRSRLRPGASPEVLGDGGSDFVMFIVPREDPRIGSA
jgi:hypothetical protein